MSGLIFCKGFCRSRRFKVTVHTDVSREVFSRVFRENPELSGAKRSFLPFLCIAKRIAGHGVNSKGLRAGMWRKDYNRTNETMKSNRGEVHAAAAFHRD